MIINGGARCNWRFFARHLMRSDNNERVRIAEIRGLASRDVLGGLREMEALAGGTRCKNFFYHASLNPRAGEDLTEAQWDQATDRLEHNLGLDGHSRIVIEHVKPDGRIHRHVLWSRIDPDSMTAVSDSGNYARHERTARVLERQFGQERVQGAHVEREGVARPARRPAGWETFRGQRSGIDPQMLTDTLTALWQRADTGIAFRAALEDAGYLLCKGDRRDFVLIDPAGDDHSLARRIMGAKAADIRARMRDIDRDRLPSVAEGRALARRTAAGNPPAAAGTEHSEPLPVHAPIPMDAARQPPRLPRDGWQEVIPGSPIDRDGWTDYVPVHPSRREGWREGVPGSSTERDGWKEYRPGERSGWQEILPHQSGDMQRLTPWGSGWRDFSDRAAAFADAAHAVYDEHAHEPVHGGVWIQRMANPTSAGVSARNSRLPGGWADAIAAGPRPAADWASRLRPPDGTGRGRSR